MESAAATPTSAHSGPRRQLRTLRRAPADDHRCGSHRARPAGVLADFSSFYFNTALSARPAALPSLLAVADADHITFGSDYPRAPLPARKYIADNLDNYDGLYEAELDGINRSNAQSLLPRLARKD
jgi:hypothetical protein